MASSTHDHLHHLHLPTTPHAATTAAPPPTPSSNTTNTTSTTTPDVLSHLLHRLPPTLSLSLPTRHTATTTTTITPPLLSLPCTPSSPLHSAATQHGFFHLTNHTIPHHPDAEPTAVSLFNLPHDQKQLLFPTTTATWPLGYDDDPTESFCLDTSSSELPSDVDLGSLKELGRGLEKLGLEVVEGLAAAAGFANPARDDPSRLCSLLWVSDGMSKPGRMYPYVVGLHYPVNCRKYSVLSDSGWVNVSGRADSVFVTLGDIAQVWSNGKFKKIRGIPMPCADAENSSNCVTMSLLITLPLESMVAPLIPDLVIDGVEEHEDCEDNSLSSGKQNGEQSLFRSFSFEDYAWRVYHERLLLKDPLVRYRV